MITSPKKPGKENLFDGNTDSNVNSVPSVPPPVEEKPGKKKRKGFEVKHEESKIVDVSATDNDQALNKNKKKLKAKGSKEIVKGDVSTDVIEKVDGNVIIPKTKETKLKKIKGLKEVVAEKISTGAVAKVNDVQQAEKDIKKSVDNGKEDIIHENKKPKAKKVKGSTGVVGDNVITGATEKVNGVHQPENDIKNKVHEGGVVLDDKCDKKANQHLEDNKTLKVKRNAMNLCTNFFEAVIPLPTGYDLVNIAGVDLPKEDAGNALQLLEFCSTFGKVTSFCHLIIYDMEFECLPDFTSTL